MSKLKSFIKLDYMTAKPHLKGRNLLILAFLAVLFAMDGVAAGITSALYIGAIFVFMFIGFPFMLSEKNNMDALYPTLGADKRTVVFGRYIFTILICIGVVMIAVIPSILRMMFTSLPDTFTANSDILVPVAAFSSFIVIAGATLLPIYFKYGYNKSKFAVIFPIVFMIGAIASFRIIGGDSGANFIQGAPEMFSLLLTDNPFGVVLLVLVLVFVVFVSYNLSLAFYKKREF